MFEECDWEVYKNLRLASLQDSPDSFGSTFEDEAKLNKDGWMSRMSPYLRSYRILPLVAEVNGTPVGLAFGNVHTSESTCAHVYQMWVSPEFRGFGVGAELLIQIKNWAQDCRLGSLSLAVTTSNEKAVALYSSFGFRPRGDLEPLRKGSSLLVQPMEMILGISGQ